MGRKGFPVEFRRRALDLVAAGRPLTNVARDLYINSQSIGSAQTSVDRLFGGSCCDGRLTDHRGLGVPPVQ